MRLELVAGTVVRCGSQPAAPCLPAAKTQLLTHQNVALAARTAEP